MNREREPEEGTGRGNREIDPGEGTGRENREREPGETASLSWDEPVLE